MAGIDGSDALAVARELGYKPRLAFKAAEAAAIIGISPTQVYKLIDSGQLATRRLSGRDKRGAVIPYQEIDKWIRGGGAE